MIPQRKHLSYNVVLVLFQASSCTFLAYLSYTTLTWQYWSRRSLPPTHPCPHACTRSHLVKQTGLSSGEVRQSKVAVRLFLGTIFGHTRAVSILIRSRVLPRGIDIKCMTATVYLYWPSNHLLSSSRKWKSFRLVLPQVCRQWPSHGQHGPVVEAYAVMLMLLHHGTGYAVALFLGSTYWVSGLCSEGHELKFWRRPR